MSIRFEVPADLAQTYAFKAGQHLTVRRSLGGEDVRRNYSVCAAPRDGELRIAIKAVAGGRFSSWANSELAAGDVLEVMAPQGHFTWPFDAGQSRTYLGIEGLKIDVAKLETDRSLSNNQLQIENYKALLGYYDMAKQVALQQAKILSDNYFALKNIVADASKVGAQVNAQMAASAYGTIHAGASISGADQTSTSFNYSGDTADTRSAPEYT